MKIITYTITITTIVFGYLTGNYFFPNMVILMFILGRLMQLKVFSNILNRKLTKNLLLEEKIEHI